MALQMPVSEPPPRLASCSSAETSVDIVGLDHSELGSAWNLDDEISDFITRHVLEKDAQFFDG